MGLGGPGDTPPHPKHATSIMTNIEKVYDDYLYDCHIANQRLTPEDWAYCGKEEHHIEIPNRDGGVLTPCNSQYLTTYQHWVAGVLQSEVLQKICYAFVPKGVLPLRVDLLRKKWASKHGLNNSYSGLLERIRTAEGSSRGGKVSGAQNVANGHLARLRTPEHQSKAGKKARDSETYEVKAERARRIPADRRILGASKVGRQSVENKTGIHSEEFKAKRKKAIILTTLSGEELRYSSIKEAAEAHNLLPNQLCNVCKGTRRHHKGFTARYADL
jgi:hypothetical protein